MANGKDLLSGILSKDTDRGSSWKNLATSYFSGSGKNNKRRRNAALFSFGVDLVQSKMQNNVINNLQESDDKKVFEQAGLTQKWNAYNKLITDDRAFKEDNKFFFKKAETKWGTTNPDYDKDTLGLGESATTIKNQEIKDLQKRYEEIHNTKLKTGNINSKNYMTKETFFKPFEDYYTEESKRIAAPKNLSLVHNGWDRLTNKFKNEEKDKKGNAQITVEEATRSTFGYLIEPDAITGSAAIDAYRKGKKGFDTTEIKMDIDTAKVNILNMSGIETDQKNYLINNLGTKPLTRNALQAKIVTLSANFDPFVAKREEANILFDKQWTDSDKKIPTKGAQEYQNYILRKVNFADIQTKQGDKELNQLRNDMFLLRDLQSKPIENKVTINFLEGRIREAGLDKVQSMALNTAMSSIADPNVILTLELLGKNSGKTKEELTQEHMKKSFEAMLDFADSVFDN